MAGGFRPAVMQHPDHCAVQALMQVDSWHLF